MNARVRSPATLPRVRPPRAAAGADSATYARLLEAATRLFAERGFARVGVRDICAAAGANVAAVNYHFGDKARLYRAVIDAAIADVRRFSDHAMAAPAGATPEAALRHYVRAHIVRKGGSRAAGRAALLRELFRHELAEPSATGAYMVEQALHPRLSYLEGVVSALVGAGAPAALVRHSVISIQAQCLMPVGAPLAVGLVPPRTRADFERLAEHVVTFSLAALRALGSEHGRPRGRRRA